MITLPGIISFYAQNLPSWSSLKAIPNKIVQLFWRTKEQECEPVKQESLIELLQRVGHGMYNPLSYDYLTATLQAVVEIPKVRAKIWNGFCQSETVTSIHDVRALYEHFQSALWSKGNPRRDPKTILDYLFQKLDVSCESCTAHPLRATNVQCIASTKFFSSDVAIIDVRRTPGSTVSVLPSRIFQHWKSQYELCAVIVKVAAETINGLYLTYIPRGDDWVEYYGETVTRHKEIPDLLLHNSYLFLYAKKF